MAKIRKSFIGILACLVLLLAGSLALTACSSMDYTVTFSIEGKEQTVDAVDGKVTFPNDPTKDYYEFRGWYTTETFDEGTEFTKDTKINGNVKVYAYFAPIYVNIAVNGSAATEIKLENLTTKTTEYTADATSKSLTFDGWYIDAAYGTKYTTQDTDNLYARYLASVTFDNSYEVLYTQNVVENSHLTAPHTTVDNFVKTYMDDEDISYVDESGNAVDFDTFTVTENTTLTVLWKTPRLEYKQIGNTGKYVVSGLDLTGLHDVNEIPYPAVSILSHNVTVDDNGTKGEVVGVEDFGFWVFKQAGIAIFNEGIEYISGLNMSSGDPNVLKTVKLPSTLKVVERSFINMDHLEKLELPNGLEVAIDCFWTDSNRETKLPVDIVIPSSVTNLAIVPKGLDLSKNSKFAYDGGLLYKVENNEKILCAVYQSKVENNRLVVAEGVTGVQVGILVNLEFDYLDLPSTFKTVGYNNKAENYTAYTGNSLTESAVVDNAAVPVNTGNISSYAIVGNLNKLKYVTINLSAMPAGISDYAFVSENGSPYNGSEFTEDEKVVLIGEVQSGSDVKVVIKKVATMDGITNVINLNTYKSGDTLNESALVEAAALDASEHEWTITVLGNTFEGGVITNNQYITIEYKSTKVGYTYIDNGDGTATVTGFNQNGAESLNSGLYRVNIHYATADGLIITAIKDEAFMGNQAIAEVYISNGVKTIGARAFKNMTNLSKVSVTAGGLEEIKESAFENAGATYNQTTERWEITAGVNSLTMQIPLAKLTSIEPYAFKTVAIKDFTAVAGEEKRYLISFGKTSCADPEGFYYVHGTSGSEHRGIVKYVSTSEEKGATVYDVQYVAAAGGYYNSLNQYGYAAIGHTLRGYNGGNNTVLRYEVMEGSFYFLRQLNFGIGIVSKIHANAFTDCGTGEDLNYFEYYVEKVSGSDNVTWLSEEDLYNQVATVFEEGWYNGLANSENGISESTHQQFSNTALAY